VNETEIAALSTAVDAGDAFEIEMLVGALGAEADATSTDSNWDKATTEARKR